MRVISIDKCQSFLDENPVADSPFKAWLAEAKIAQWKSPLDVKKRYSTASIIAGNRVVFNIGGNKYRLVVKVNYPYGIVEIRFFGSHAEYDQIYAEKI